MVESHAPTGDAENEQSGYVLAFAGEERILANEVPSTLIANLTTPA